MFGDLEQIEDAEEAGGSGELGCDVGQAEGFDGIDLNVAFFHGVATADFDAWSFPDADAEGDVAAANSVAKPLGEDHEKAVYFKCWNASDVGSVSCANGWFGSGRAPYPANARWAKGIEFMVSKCFSQESFSVTHGTNGTLDGIWIIDAEGNTVLANARMSEILGSVSGEMIGESSFSYIFPEDVAAAQRLFEAKSEGDSKPFHFRLRRKDGSEIWVDVQGTPMRNVSGEFSGIVGTFTVSGEQAA